MVEFQFPSNGKVDRKLALSDVASLVYGIGFNSLQTGRWIASFVSGDSVKVSIVFQFPSNGKVDRKELTDIRNAKVEVVSIPFKREGGSQAIRWPHTTCPVKCFNSLQTGRWIASIDPHVSIGKFIGNEFQFPSNGKVDRKHQYAGTPHVVLEFQFPSNGKVDRKTLSKILWIGCS